LGAVPGTLLVGWTDETRGKVRAVESSEALGVTAEAPRCIARNCKPARWIFRRLYGRRPANAWISRRALTDRALSFVFQVARTEHDGLKSVLCRICPWKGRIRFSEELASVHVCARAHGCRLKLRLEKKMNDSLIEHAEHREICHCSRDSFRDIVTSESADV